MVPWFVLLMEPAWRKKVWSIVNRPLTRAMGLFLAASYISSLLGSDFSQSFWGTEERGTGLLTLTQVFIWFVLTRATHDTQRAKNMLIHVISLGGLVASIIALVRLTGVVLFGIDTGLRIAGTMANPIFFSGLLILYIGVALQGLFSQKNTNMRWLYAGLAVFQTVVLFLTQTRSAAIGLIGGVLLAALIALLAATSKKVKRAAGGFIAAIAIGVVMLFVFADAIAPHAPRIARLLVFEGLEDRSLQTRFYGWESGLEAFKDRPLFGWGQESYRIAFDQYYNADILAFGFNETRFDRAHNIIIETLVTGGLVGLTLYFGVIFIFLFQVCKAGGWKEPRGIAAVAVVAAYGVHLLFSFDTSSSLLLIAAFMLLYEKTEALERTEEPLHTKKQVLLLVVIVLACYGSYRISYLPYVQSVALIDNMRFATQRSRVQAVGRYEGILAISSPYKNEARGEYIKNTIRGVQEGVFHPDQVKGLIERTEVVSLAKAADHPLDSFHTYLVGVLYFTARDLDPTYPQKSIDYFERAIALSQRQQYRFALAELYIELGRPEEANAVYKAAVEQGPKAGISHWYYGLSLLTTGEVDAGLDSIEKSVELNYFPETEDTRKLYAQLLYNNERYAGAARVYFTVMGVGGNHIKPDSWVQFAIYLKDAGFIESSKLAAEMSVTIDPAYTKAAALFISELPDAEAEDLMMEEILEWLSSVDIPNQ